MVMMPAEFNTPIAVACLIKTTWSVGYQLLKMALKLPGKLN
jgi:hypothetical protein